MTVISSNWQIVLPAAMRAQDGIQPGQQFDIERLGRGEYLLRRTPGPRNEGVLELLLACPAKGWFRPANRTETTAQSVGPGRGHRR